MIKWSNFSVLFLQIYLNSSSESQNSQLTLLDSFIQAGDRVLIVSHANTIRALVKAVDKVRIFKFENHPGCPAINLILVLNLLYVFNALYSYDACTCVTILMTALSVG